MFKKLIPALILLLLTSASAFSNNSPFPGYYIDKTGDTIRCTIDFADWNRNPKTIHVEINNESKEFGPDDIKGFGVDGYDDYISGPVTYHIAPFPGSVYPSEYPDKTVTGTYFLKILAAGSYSLYSLLVSEKTYLFYRNPDGSVSELIYRLKMNNGILQEDLAYRQQIFSLFELNDMSGRYINRINNAKYTAADISYLFNSLNGNHNKTAGKGNSFATLQPEIFFGTIRNSFPTKLDGDYLKQVQVDPYTTITGGANLLISFPGIFHSIKLGAGAGYNNYTIIIRKTWATEYDYPGNQYTTNYNENIIAKNSMLFSSVYMMWVVNPLTKVQAYIKAGGTYHHSLNNYLDFTTDYTTSTQGTRNGIPFENSNKNQNTLIPIYGNYLTLAASVGASFGRHSLEFSYWPATDIAAPPEDRGLTQKSFKIASMGIFYYYSLTSVKKINAEQLHSF